MTPEQIKEKFNIYFKNWVHDPNDNRCEKNVMTDFAISIADELQREAFKAGMMTMCDHPLKDEWIEEEYQQWKEKQQ